MPTWKPTLISMCGVGTKWTWETFLQIPIQQWSSREELGSVRTEPTNQTEPPLLDLILYGELQSQIQSVSSLHWQNSWHRRKGEVCEEPIVGPALSSGERDESPLPPKRPLVATLCPHFCTSVPPGTRNNRIGCKWHFQEARNFLSSPNSGCLLVVFCF